jgi:hypothetical protein
MNNLKQPALLFAGAALALAALAAEPPAPRLEEVFHAPPHAARPGSRERV